MQDSYILAIDQGTSSTKTIIFNGNGTALYKASEPLKTFYLEGNHVEQDPQEICRNVLTSVEKCIAGFKRSGGDAGRIQALGISNQRETLVLWDREGNPLYNAVVWQCKRSVDICSRMKQEGLEPVIRAKTGLIIDPYFSGTKVMWLYEHEPEIKRAIDRGEAYFGTVDTWLLYKFTRGASYMTDFTNASRTMFFNLKERTWDQELLEMFGLSGLNLPGLRPSACDYGMTDLNGLLDRPIRIAAMIGDSHAAAFGEGCFDPGTAKATLGTGCSVLMNIGGTPGASESGMVTTICWSLEDRIDYALEGIIVSCGATIEWIKNELGLFSDTGEIGEICRSLKDNNGVYLVPAFSGLGAPHWEMDRKASIEGLTFDCNKNHIIRAAAESVPYQIKDVIAAMERDSHTQLQELKVDGGITSNQFVLQWLTDLLDRPVVNIGIADVSALGAAYMAGLTAGIYNGLDHLRSLNTEAAWKAACTYPGPDREAVKKYYAGWQRAVAKKS